VSVIIMFLCGRRCATAMIVWLYRTRDQRLNSRLLKAVGEAQRGYCVSLNRLYVAQCDISERNAGISPFFSVVW
jgi:hypothetical protein